jgi:threonine dehydrogenase-like Zn-dependent dehydrogenase
VGIDAEPATHGPAATTSSKKTFKKEKKQAAPETNPDGDLWQPGDAPSQALRWAVSSLAKAGSLSVVGVYPQTVDFFPFGEAMNKNLTINAGNCNHRRYIPKLQGLIHSGVVDLDFILSNKEPLPFAVDAYKEFDTRQPGWLKVELEP